MPSADRSLMKLATIGAVALALLLAACGRKGPLELPPGAPPAPQASATPAPTAPATVAPTSFDGEEPPAVPTPARKRIFLDWLLD